MDRRRFIATGAGSGVALLVGVGALFGDDGPDFGSIPTPPSSESVTLDNGRKAALYENGTIAFFGASLVSQFSGVPAVVGRLKNVSDATLGQVRTELQFIDDSGEVLIQGWISRDDLAAGQAWPFVANYPGNDTNRLATAKVIAIDAV